MKIDAKHFLVPPRKNISLKNFLTDFTGTFKDKKNAAKKLENDIVLLAGLQDVFYAQRSHGLLIILQGMDTAGKDGTIKHIMSGVNPQGVTVHSFKQPSEEELAHDYLWRAMKAMPRRGEIGIFNRSYYEEVLVTRVRPEVLAKQNLPEDPDRGIWGKRFDDIIGAFYLKYSYARQTLMTKHKLWLAAICLLIFPLATSKGSSVAIIVTGSEIVIAADGVLTKTTNNVTSHLKYCKIRGEGATFYTAVGSYGLPEINFDLWNLARTAIRQAKTVDGIYDVIQPKVLARLPTVIRRTRSIDKLDYDSWLRGNPIISISFAAIERGIPTVATINFGLDRTGKIGIPTRRTLFGASGVVQNAFLGHNAEMNVAIGPRSWGFSFLRDPTGFIQGLIQREIDASTKENRNDVGPPISVLRITSSGGHFEVGYKGACP